MKQEDSGCFTLAVDGESVTESAPALSAVADVVSSHYGRTPSHVELLHSSMRDVFEVRADDERTVLIVYGVNRQQDEVRAEWQFVSHLSDHGIPVARAIECSDGSLISLLSTPEGERLAVLVEFVDGTDFRSCPDETSAREFGRTIARIHEMSGDLALTREPHDDRFFLDSCLTAIERAFPEREELLEVLRAAMPVLRQHIHAVPRTPPTFGVIHGDVIRANALILPDGRVCVMDFDLCGLGWRAYDIASFLQASSEWGQDAYGQAFVGGYSEIRELTDIEHASLPAFQAARSYFSLGIPAMHVHRWGKNHVAERFFQHAMDYVSNCLERL